MLLSFSYSESLVLTTLEGLHLTHCDKHIIYIQDILRNLFFVFAQLRSTKLYHFGGWTRPYVSSASLLSFPLQRLSKIFTRNEHMSPKSGFHCRPTKECFSVKFAPRFKCIRGPCACDLCQLINYISLNWAKTSEELYSRLP